MSPEMAALLVEMEEAYPKIQGQFKGEQKCTGEVYISAICSGAVCTPI
jgi:hypothetical protein